MTDGVVGPPIPSGPDDGWGVSPDPSVSVIRPRIGPRSTMFSLLIDKVRDKDKTYI